MEIQKEFSWPDQATQEWQLLNDYQRNFPLTKTPFLDLAEKLGRHEDWVLGQLTSWQEMGVLSRLGPVFRPQALGASTLAAVQVKEEDLEPVAQFINSFSEVNHNYLREADINLWFVVTAPTEARLQEVLLAIGERAGSPVLDCRLQYEFRIDLGFSLNPNDPAPEFVEQKALGPASLAEIEQQLCRLIQKGLPLVSRPYAQVAQKLQLTETQVVEKIQFLCDQGVIRRFGLVLRHRPLGFSKNAMTVWQLPEDQVQRVGRALTQYSCVTLCYQRKSHSDWPYNLYCMIHGKSRPEVEAQVNQIVEELHLETYPSQVLFSTKAFKQRGARYLADKTISESEIEKILLNRLQKGIAVEDRPYHELAQELGLNEGQICDRLQKMRQGKLLTRFGPMYNIEKLGGEFNLVAMEVPRERWDEVLELVNAFPEVAHNYEREHQLNMWFVLTSLPASKTAELLGKIEQATGLKTYAMPKLKEFYLNLQFDSGGGKS